MRLLNFALAFSVPLATAWQINWYSDENCQNYVGSQSGSQTGVSYAECDEPAPPEDGARSFIAMMDATNDVRVCDGGPREWNQQYLLFFCECYGTLYAGHNDNECQTIKYSVTGKWIDYTN
ncbi:hypothetical protein F5884DRAFT_751518 [Xylogone sp. PMI_703]|nr:hypothetical protein F5884DRAFT_751518 [Xylogone sp. PMI_703]